MLAGFNRVGCSSSTLRLPSLSKFIFNCQNLSLTLSSSTIILGMEGESVTRLVLCGKSVEENKLAKSLKSNSSLKLPDNSEVSVHLHSVIEGMDLEHESFRIGAYLDVLSTSRFGKFLIYSPRLGSTHDIVSHKFSELAIGTVCVADVQTKGRGRSKNVWESPKGCLLFSYTIQMEDGKVVPFVQYVVSLAMTEAIKDLCQQKE